MDAIRRSPWEDGAGREHGVVQAVGWVDHELSSRLAAIDRKLDLLSLQVTGYHSSVSKFHGYPAAEKDMPQVPNAAELSLNRVQDAWCKDSVKSVLMHNEPVNDVSEAWKMPALPVEAAHSSASADTRASRRGSSRDRKEARLALISCSKDVLEPPWALAVFPSITDRALKLRLVMDDPEHSRMARWYSILMPCFVIVSILPTLMQTANSPPLTHTQHAAIELTVEAILFFDIFLRFLVAANLRAFFSNLHNILDILVLSPLVVRASKGFVPTYEDLDTMPGSMLLYIVPILRLLKTLRGFRKFSLVMTVAMKVYLETLPTIFMLVYLVLIFATLFYYIEPRSNIENYGKAIWFVCVTMTTVGYGDLTPVTTVGYMAASVLVCSSVFVMAMPLGIIGTAVSEIWKDRDTIILRKWAKERLDQWGYRASDIPQFFDAFDTDGSGELDFTEFCDMLAEMKVDIKVDRLRQLFKSFDDDDSGLVDAKEFVKKLYPAQYDELYGSSDDKIKVKQSIREDSLMEEARYNLRKLSDAGEVSPKQGNIIESC